MYTEQKSGECIDAMPRIVGAAGNVKVTLSVCLSVWKSVSPISSLMYPGGSLCCRLNELLIMCVPCLLRATRRILGAEIGPSI